MSLKSSKITITFEKATFLQKPYEKQWIERTMTET